MFSDSPSHRRLHGWHAVAVTLTLVASSLLLPATTLAQDASADPLTDLTLPSFTLQGAPGAPQQGEPADADAAAPADAAPAEDTGDGLSLASANAVIWYVDGNRGSDGTCNTSSAPCRTIQAAVDRAASGDVILVAGSAGGTVYTFAGANGCTNEVGATAVVCVLRKQLTIRGGYASGNYSTYAPFQNITVIDGQGRNRGVFVLSYNSPGSTALELDGFTVRNGLGMGIGKRPGEDNFFGFGGGMFVEYAGTIVLRDVTFSNNTALGNVRTSGYGGAGSGGGASFRSTGKVTLDNVRFANNQAVGGAGATRGGLGLGGGIYSFQTTIVGSRLAFDSNLAQGANSAGNGEDNGRAEGFGGAASFETGSNVTLTRLTAVNNRTVGGNAAVNAGGGFGGAFMAEQAALALNNANIIGNMAQGGNAQTGYFANGGGVMAINSTVSINQSVVALNTAQGGNGTSGKFGVPNGGGVMVSWTAGAASRLTMTNVIVAANRAYKGTGAQVEIGGGGGLWIQATDANLDHVTVADNSLTPGIGMLGQGFFILNTGSRGANVTIHRSLITGHNGGEGSAVEVLKGNTTTFDGGLFHGNRWDTSATYPVVVGGGNAGVINGLSSMQQADPQYLAPGASKYDYHIQSGSPARNKVSGNSLGVDVDGQARNDGSADWGADEYSAPPAPAITITGLAYSRSSISLSWAVAGDSSQIAKFRLVDRYNTGSEKVDTIDLGKSTSYTLRDLSPFVLHTLVVQGLNSSDQVVSTAVTLKVMTTDRRLSLPAIRR